MDFESSYNAARSRYSNACSEINKCENRLNELRTQKQNKVNQINQLKVDIKDNQEAHDNLVQIISGDSNLNSGILNIGEKTSQAAENFINMVNSSDVTSKDLTEVYSVEMTGTKNTINIIFDTLNTKKNILSTRIAELQMELKTAEADLQDIEAAIKSTESSLQEWRRIKSNASIDMEYNRQKMYAAI